MRILAVIVAAAAGYACTSYDPTLGATPFFCGSAAPQCPDGYTCMGSGSGSGVCSKMPTSTGSCAMAFSGALATWNLASEPGSQTSTAAASSAPGVTASSLARSPALMAQTGAGSINASGWPMGAQRDNIAYFTLSITPPSSCALDLTSLSLDVKASSTGPTAGSVSTSADAFAQQVAVSTSTPSTPALTVTGATGAVEVRIYGFQAAATTGTMRIENTVTATGALR